MTIKNLTPSFLLKLLVILIGLGCIVMGVIMTYQEKKIVINQTFFYAGLILFFLGLVLIIIGIVMSIGDAENIKKPNLKGIWNKIIIILILLAVIIFLLCKGKGLSVISLSQYEIFKDLLTILLTLIGVVGVGIFLLIRRFILDEVKDKINYGEVLVWRSYNIDLGFLCYILAENLDVGKEFKKQMKERALYLTSKALEEITLSPILEKHNIITAKNNLAYYSARIHEQEGGIRWDLKKGAEEFVEEIRSKYKKGDRLFGNIEWLETYAFVKARFAQTDEEKMEAIKIIQGLLKNPDLRPKKEELQKSFDYLKSPPGAGTSVGPQ